MFRMNRVVSLFMAVGLVSVSGQVFSANSVKSDSRLPSDTRLQTPTIVSDSFIEARNLYFYGMKLFNDSGSDKDLSKAFKLFKQAAVNGFPLAGYQLGIMYRDGTGVARNKTIIVLPQTASALWGIYRLLPESFNTIARLPMKVFKKIK